jgi:dynein light chain LC8-type
LPQQCTAESGEEGWVGWETPRFNAFIGLLEFTNDSVVSRTAIMADEEEEKEQFIRPYKTMRAEMPEEMQDSAILHINKALDKFKIEKDVATYMKKTFDEEHGATWHCVVGKTFGCSITFETKFVLFFETEQQHVLLFKSME